MTRWMLLVFLTLGMHGIYTTEEAVVTDVHHGVVTMECDRGVYQIDEHEAWRVGDRAEVVVGKSGIVGERYRR